MGADFAAWHDRTRAQHDARTAELAALGYRTSSLALYGERADPRYAAVMIKRPIVHASRQFSAMTLAEFQQQVIAQQLQGMFLYLVSACGPVTNPLFAAVFRPASTPPLMSPALTEAQLRADMLMRWRDNMIPIALDAYGAPGDLRYVAVWQRNAARTPWNFEAMAGRVDGPTMQARYDAITSAWGRMAGITMTPGGGYHALFVTTPAGGGEARAGLTAAEYQGVFDAQVKLGRVPLRIAAEGAGAATRFSVIFADTENPIGRAIASRGPVKIDAIDKAMSKFMVAHDMRGCALAIVSGTRLVYARGYTFAEAGYPQTEPTTFFRQASVSKLFAAAAIRAMIQNGVKTAAGVTVTLDTKMQAILKLKTPAGKDPVDSRFADITLRHLLESNASLNQGLIWSHVTAALMEKGALPCNTDRLAAYAATLELGTPDPGDTTNTVYGNAEYFLLSQVVKVLGKAGNFEAALQNAVLTPLGVTRVRGSNSLLKDQKPGEARYHEVNINPEPRADKPLEWTDYWQTLGFGSNSRATTPAVVPHAYGSDNYEIFDGCGGLSAAVTDVARLIAALNLRAGNPVFTTTTLDAWFRDTVAATKHTGPDAHGYHGFDWGVTNPALPIGAVGNFTASKGGWLPSHSSYVYYVSGGLSFIVAANSVGQPDVKTDWLFDLDGDGGDVADPGSVWAVASARDWSKDADLFPGFGMASFAGPVVKQQIIAPLNLAPALRGEALTRTSMIAQRPAAIRIRPRGT